jgi:prepilin-type N-terminal cleavage/methylation domain-containing protein
MKRSSAKRPITAFTLIELLVVVSVVAILATIAVPNYMGAQTRAKVSRVYTDFSAMRVAATAYSVDHRQYPRMTWGSRPFYDSYGTVTSGLGTPVAVPISGTMGYWITTPVAYLTHFDFMDPFTGPNGHVQTDARLYTYHDWRTLDALTNVHNVGYLPLYPQWFAHAFGGWAMMSLGPNLATGSSYVTFHEVYDPTNGTISDGNIWWSERFTAPRMIRFGEFD